MFIVFHQNMRVFGGSSAPRNAAYATQMGLIGAAATAFHGQPSMGVAGFTELHNFGAPLRTNLLGIAQSLDAGLTRLLIIEVGTSLVGAITEYIGIAWDPNWLNVQHAGQVVWHSMKRDWIGKNTPAGGFGALHNVLALAGVAGLGADQRGLAYIACQRAANGNRYIIAFLHNMYTTGDRTRAMDSMDTMISRAKAGAGLVYAAAEVIVGGDFNVVPPPATRAKRKRRSGLTTRVARNLAGAALNTTLANPYDYWMVSDAAGITDADATRYIQTRQLPCSDHAGVTVDRS